MMRVMVIAVRHAAQRNRGLGLAKVPRGL